MLYTCCVAIESSVERDEDRENVDRKIKEST